MEIFSLGTAALSIDEFMKLLKGAGVNAVADVRTSPYSKQFPWFNQQELKVSLRNEGIQYVFLGNELGGRPKETTYFQRGVADYAAMAKSSDFLSGIERLISGSRTLTIALVCSERDPLHCHRCLLVGRHLRSLSINVTHIHASGALETQLEAEERLVAEENLVSEDFLFSKEERLREAYLRRNLQVAYSEPKKNVAGEKWQKNR